MNRFLLSLLLIGTLCLMPLAAVDGDWGATFDNATSIRNGGTLDDPEWEEVFRTAVWGAVRQDLNGGGTAGLMVQGSYTFTDDRAYLFDLDLLRASGAFPGALGGGSVLELAAGRILFRDATGKILEHVADGVQLGLLWSGVHLRFGAGYTGLLLNPSSDIRISGSDWAEEEDDSDYFGPKRVLLQASLGLPGALWYQYLTIQGLAQFDLRDDENAETINSQFLGFATTRRLGKAFYLDSDLTLSSGQSSIAEKETFLVSAMYGLGLRYFNERALASRAHLSFQYGSGFIPLVLIPGFEDYSLEDFTPINQPATGLVFSPRIGNLMYVDFGYSLRPFNGSANDSLAGIQPMLGVRVYFRSWTSDVLASGIDPDSDSLYLGTEAEVGLSARIFSDLGLSLRTGVFLPGTDGAGAFTSDRKPEFLGKLEISASL